jgi:ribosomal protein L29
MDFSELSKKTEKELRELLKEQKKLLYNDKFAPQKQNHNVGNFKKTIARILTILNTKKS